MRSLVNETGSITFGMYPDRIDHVNYEEYRLETPMGIPVPRILRQIMANQFHFTGIIGPELIIGMAVVDLKYLGNGFVYIYDRRANTMTDMRKLQAGSCGVSIDPSPDTGRSIFTSPSLVIKLNQDRISARGEGFDISATLDLSGTHPLRICSRAGYRGWVYTQKTTPVPLTGSVRLRDRSWDIASPSYMALIDWTCGYMRRQTFWNWASTACTLPDGRSLGWNFSCGVNETSFTENAFWVDSAMTKVDTVNFVFEPNDLMRPWHITSCDQKVDLTFHPASRRGEKISALVLSSRFTQLLGVFEGTLRCDDASEIVVKDCPGFAEDHYAKW
ncbi:MAG TPA: DUF2804 domain-containing protein [Deltaproteobacteria bacterium]|nr:DUF2804 domain-containing protein [Deltaproteobacteria bacterium]